MSHSDIQLFGGRNNWWGRSSLHIPFLAQPFGSGFAIVQLQYTAHSFGRKVALIVSVNFFQTSQEFGAQTTI